jgi:hypothetical protein
MSMHNIYIKSVLYSEFTDFLNIFLINSYYKSEINSELINDFSFKLNTFILNNAYLKITFIAQQIFNYQELLNTSLLAYNRIKFQDILFNTKKELFALSKL